jgi:hypothetical protein
VAFRLGRHRQDQVLSARVLRLLLQDGVEPENILC